MSQDSKPYRRIRADEVKELKSWSLPQVGSVNLVGLKQKNKEQVKVVEEEIAAEKITLAELESIRENARLEGLSAGLEEGRAEGQVKGREAGFAEGREQGYREGFAQGEAEVERLQSLLQGMLSELERPADQVAAEIESLLLNLVVQLSETVVGVELSQRQDLLAEAIHSALEQLPESSGQVKIRVNEADRPYLEEVFVDDRGDNIIAEDASIAPGGFKMETMNTLVRHEVESRFAHVAEQLLASLSQPEMHDEQDS
jgi:flagellar assembly protein FliH